MKLYKAAATVVAAFALTPAVAQDGEPIRIGSVLSVTGPASFLGDPEEKTLELYVDRINEDGGVLGRPLALTVYDSVGDANSARTFATRLIEDDEIVAMVGGSTTGTTMAMVPLFEDYEIPFISLAGAVVIIDPVKPYVFKTPHTDRMACRKIFQDLQQRGITGVGMISGTGGFGKSMRGQCLDVASQYDLEIVADETYGPRDSDMTPAAHEHREHRWARGDRERRFRAGPCHRDAQHGAARHRAALLPVPRRGLEVLHRSGGDAAEGVRLPAGSLLVAEKLPAEDPQRPVVVDYNRTYEEATGDTVSTFGGHAYDGLMILVDAIERAGSTDSRAIRDAIEETEGFMGTAGRVTMSEDDHLGLDFTAFRMIEIRDGDWALLD